MLKHQHRLLADSVLLGVVGALSAQAFMFLLSWSQKLFLGLVAGYRPLELNADGSLTPAAAGPHHLWLIPLSTTLGGLLAGLIVYTLAPEAEGHGTDSAVNAFHRLRGVIRTRVPFVKMIASAITIGSGGSAGREGPTALISAGVGSWYARKFNRSEKEVRTLVLVGMAAGLSAIFGSPIGTAIFAIEVLYSETEFESGALVYTVLGSIVAYAVNGFFVGFQPLFHVPPSINIPDAIDYGWYVVLGVVCGVVATILPMALYLVRDAFRLIRCPPHFKPAIAGFLVGLVALVLPQILGGGYGWIQEAINGSLPGQLLILLAVGKILTFSLTIGSGGSGGVFAPSLYTGAMVGAFLSQLFHRPSAAFAVVGMAAVFGAAAKVPIATLLMVTHMTGGYNMLVAGALAVTLSSLVQTVLSAHLKYRSLYEAQVPSRPYSPAHSMEHIQIALELLKNRGTATSLDGPGLDLAPLLASGVPVSLGAGKQLRLGVLRPGSSCAGQPVNCLSGGQKGVEFILVLRGNEALLPQQDLKLEAGDRLVALTSETAWSGLAAHLDNVGPGPDATSHETHSPDRGTPL